MKISVFGLGYVGCVTSACIANYNYNVIGVDINKLKVQMINNKKSSIFEPGLELLIKDSIEKNKFRATMDVQNAILNSDISFICVGTPSKENGNIDLEAVIRVIEDIGKALLKKKKYHLIVIRSTVLPGTIEKIIIPTLVRISKKCIGKDIGVCMNPEFLREGTSIKDFYNSPFVIIGEFDKKSGKILKNLWINLGIDNNIIYNTEIEVAEMIKYTNNAFHALKVVFANEIGSICKKLGIDSHKVMDIFVRDNILNLSPYYLKPGFAFGGSCLPKDLRALNYLSKTEGIKTPILDTILTSNRHHIDNVLRLIYKMNKKNIGILGLTFKSGTDDVRESPLLFLAGELNKKGYSLKIYEKNINPQMLMGANKEYFEKKYHHIINFIEDSFEKLLKNSDILIIGNNEEHIVKKLKKVNLSDKIVIDLVRIIKNLDDFKIKCAGYEGIGW